jgi:hypothetical protein
MRIMAIYIDVRVNVIVVGSMGDRAIMGKGD